MSFMTLASCRIFARGFFAGIAGRFWGCSGNVQTLKFSEPLRNSSSVVSRTMRRVDTVVGVETSVDTEYVAVFGGYRHQSSPSEVPAPKRLSIASRA